jgi:hypothetical protein
MTATTRYLHENVFHRCGHAVSHLCEAGLLAPPVLASSETEINEWWLVSSELAGRLRAAGLPLLEFHELHMWGRTGSQTPLKDDLELLGAIGPLT